jgi:BirA family biotin operon repressor/biotin-[acetyl-CoA-carboxylase] ligase
MPTDAQIETLLAERTRFRKLMHMASCSSTQDVAAAAPRDGDAVFWADHQTAGRGRQQRSLFDEPGRDLAVTFRASVELPKPLALAAALPVAVLEAIEPIAGRALRVKWPNDLLLDGRKLCGVLIDTGLVGPHTWLIGVGVNCNRVRFPPELEAHATSLALATGHEVDRPGLLVAIAERLDTMLQDLAARRHDRLLATFRDRLGLLGQRVVVDAGPVHEGVLLDVDFERLLLTDDRALPLAVVRALRRAP